MQVSLEPGMTVADIGSGSGHFALEAARRVGGGGKVYAVEVNKKLVEKIAAEAQRENIFSVYPTWGDVEEEKGTHLDDGIAHLAILSNTLFQLDDKVSALKEVHRILRHNGKLIVIDWSESYGGVGPHPGHVLSLDDAKRLVKDAGFDITSMLTVGEHHYGFIAQKGL